MKTLIHVLFYFTLTQQVWSKEVCDSIGKIQEHPCWSAIEIMGGALIEKPPYMFSMNLNFNKYNSEELIYHVKRLNVLYSMNAKLEGCLFKSASIRTRKELPLKNDQGEMKSGAFFFYNSNLSFDVDNKTCEITKMKFQDRSLSKELCGLETYPSDWDLDYLSNICETLFKVKIDSSKQTDHPLIVHVKADAKKTQEDEIQKNINEECAVDEQVYGGIGMTLSPAKYNDFKKILLSIHSSQEKSPGHHEHNGYNKIFSDQLAKSPLEYLVLIAKKDTRDDYKKAAIHELSWRIQNLHMSKESEEEKEKLLRAGIEVMKEAKEANKLQDFFTAFQFTILSKSMDKHSNLLRELTSVVLDLDRRDIDLFNKESYARLILELDKKRLTCAKKEQVLWLATEEKQLAVIDEVFSVSGFFLARSPYVEFLTTGEGKNNPARLEIGIRHVKKFVSEGMITDPIYGAQYVAAVKILDENLERTKKEAKKKKRKSKKK